MSKGGSYIKGTFLSEGVENGDCEATRVQFILSVSIPGFFSKGGSDIKGFFLPWVFKGLEDAMVRQDHSLETWGQPFGFGAEKAAVKIESVGKHESIELNTRTVKPYPHAI